jgi:hypothetical protein
MGKGAPRRGNNQGRCGGGGSWVAEGFSVTGDGAREEHGAAAAAGEVREPTAQLRCATDARPPLEATLFCSSFFPLSCAHKVCFEDADLRSGCSFG